MSEANKEIREALNDAGFTWVERVVENRSALDKSKLTSVSLEVQYHDVNFEDLVKLSDYFGTRDMNIDNETREGGYCETCRYSYAVTVITIMNATKGLL